MRDGKGQNVYEEERAKLGDAIDAIPRMTSWLWERDAPVGEYSAEETCVHVAGTSDCLVLALGTELTPTTRKEYDAARRAKAHCFIFQDSRVEPSEVKAFVEAERDHAVTGRFSSAEDLARQAVDHLTRRAVYFLRRAIVSQRRTGTSTVTAVEDRAVAWSQPPVQRKYEEQEVAFGDSPDKPKSFRTVTEIVAAQRERAEQGDDEQAFAELSGVAFMLWEYGRADLALEVLEDLRQIVPPGRMAPADEAWLLNTRALALARLGKSNQADELWTRMLSVGERLGDKHLRAVAMQNLAISALNAHDPARAKELVRSSLELMQELEDTRSMLQLLNTLVLISTEEREYELAAEQLDSYESIAREAGDLHLLTSAAGNRGQLLAAQGHFSAAEESFREGLRLARRTRDVVDEILGLQNLGAVCADQERFGDAMRWYRKGIRLAETYELPVQVEVLRRSLATTLHRAGRNREAILEFDRARQAAWELGERHLWAQSTSNLGAVYLLSGKAAAAMEPLEKAASTFRELGELEWELRARRNLATAQRELGLVDAALDLLERARDLVPADAHEERAGLLRQAAESCLEDSEMLGRATDLFEHALEEEALYLDTAELARRAAAVGSFLSQAGAEDRAVPFYDRAVTQLEDAERGDYSLADALNDRAVGLERLERHAEARADLLRCIELTQEAGDDALRQKALANLGEVERQRGDVPAAVDACRAALELARELGDEEALSHAIVNLGLSLEEDNRPDEADAALHDLQDLADAHDVSEWKGRAATGFGAVAFIREHFDAAAEHYRRAVDIYDEAGSELVVYALGGLLESLARAGSQDGLQETAQALVDRLKEGEDPRLVINYFGRAAISWLERGDLKEGVSLLGGAALVGALEFVSGRPRDQEIDDRVRPLGEALGWVVIAARASHRFQEDTVYEAVITYLNDHDAGLGDQVEPWLQMMRDVMDERNTATEDPPALRREGRASGAQYS